MRVLRSTILFLAVAAVATAAAPLYFPLATGNRWVYREPSSGNTFIVQVGLPLIQNDRVYYKLTGYGSGPHYARVNEFGNLVGIDLDNGVEYVITGFEAVEGGWFDSLLSNCLQQAQPQRELREYSRDREPVFSALQLKYRNLSCADSGIVEELYAENVGLIERTVTTIAGPLTYTLVQARVGALNYETVPSTGLRVILDRNFIENYEATHNERLKITMRLNVHRAPPVVLRFPSPQQYDIRLRDNDGKIVYQWSEDVAPPILPSDLVVAQEVDFVQEIPLHERGGFALKGGYYTVEVWLNTANREFAGAARLFVSAAK